MRGFSVASSLLYTTRSWCFKVKREGCLLGVYGVYSPAERFHRCTCGHLVLTERRGTRHARNWKNRRWKTRPDIIITPTSHHRLSLSLSVYHWELHLTNNHRHHQRVIEIDSERFDASSMMWSKIIKTSLFEFDFPCWRRRKKEQDIQNK